MRNIATLPKTILAMEALGGLLIVGALVVVNRWLPGLPNGAGSKHLATALFIIGIMLMIPAAWLLMWRCAKALAPQLFNQSEKKIISWRFYDTDYRFTVQPPFNPFFH